MNIDTFETYKIRDELVLPDLRGLGWCDTRLPRLGGARSDGLDFLEVGYLKSGSMEWFTEAGLEEAPAGSIVIDWPGDWQGGSTAIIHPCERFWIRFDPAELGSAPGLAPETSKSLIERLAGMRRRHFMATPAIEVHFRQILTQQRNPGLFAEEISRAAFHQILFTLINDHDQVQTASYSRPVVDAITYMETHLGEDFHVAELAGQARLSTGHFHGLFDRETGTSPARYLATLRVHRAKLRLATTREPITDIAMDLGFATSQYFATVFKRHVGLTPGDYRRLRTGLMDERTFAELSGGTHQRTNSARSVWKYLRVGERRSSG